MTDYLTVSDIAKKFGVCRRTVAERWTKRPDFPPPARKVSARRVWWCAKEIEAWATPPQRRIKEGTK